MIVFAKFQVGEGSGREVVTSGREVVASGRIVQDLWTSVITVACCNVKCVMWINSFMFYDFVCV